MKYGLYLIKLLFFGALIILHFKVIAHWFTATLPKPPNPPPLTVHLVTLRQPTTSLPIVREVPKTTKTEVIEMEQKQVVKSLVATVFPQKAVKTTPAPKITKLPSESPVVKAPKPPAPKIQKVQEKPLVLPTPRKIATIPITPPPVAKVVPAKRDHHLAPVPSQPVPLKNVVPQENIAVKPMSSQISTAPTTFATAEKTTVVNHAENRTSAINSSTPIKNSSVQENSSVKSAITPIQKSTGGQQSQIKSPPNYQAAYLHNPKPPYPPLSRQLEEEGTVQLLVYLDARGQVRQVQLKNSCGYARLDTAALQAVQQWKFIPAKQGDIPVAATTIVPITFRLSDG